jgi:hypothetical protein
MHHGDDDDIIKQRIKTKCELANRITVLPDVMAVFGREHKESYLSAGLPAMDRSIGTAATKAIAN